MNRATYTARLVVLEEPEIAEKLSKMARHSGRSLSAEVRAALRYWLGVWKEVQGE